MTTTRTRRPSVTAWKQQLRLGMTVRVENAERPDMSGNRPFTAVQTNAFATRAVRGNGEVVEQSWFYYPTSKSMRVSDDGLTLSVWKSLDDPDNPDVHPSITYTILTNQGAVPA